MTGRKKSQIEHCMLLLITRMEDEKKIGKLLEKFALPIYFQFRGEGTATSELLSICGLRGTKRLLTLSVLPRPLIKEAFSEMSSNLFLWQKGRGIAVTIPVTGLQEGVRKILDQKKDAMLPEGEKGEPVKMKQQETSYSMILIAANYGYSDDIVNAARKAGAKGGTVIKGHRGGSESALKFLGVSARDELEFTFIIVPQDTKSSVMTEISNACGLNTPAHGVVLSIPVEQILGIET